MENQCTEKDENTNSSFNNPTQNNQISDSDSKNEIESTSRRQFITAAGGLTAATLAAGAVGMSSLTDIAEAHEKGNKSGVRSQNGRRRAREIRRARALEIRKKAAIFQLSGDFPEPQNNGDEDSFPLGLVSFSKALPHNKLGEVDQSAYRMLLQAVNSGAPSDFDRIPLAGTARLANPQSAFAFNLEGTDAWSLLAPPPPRFADEEFAAEMTECYWLALTRDVPFSQYGNEPLTAAAIDDLRRFSTFADVNPASLFRANFPGVQTGPYISQFLLQPFGIGTASVDQFYQTSSVGADHLTAYDIWLEIQNGSPALSTQAFADVPSLIYNGRVLGEWAH